MAQQPSDSLGGQNTFSGPLKKPTGPQSLGDQNTFSGGSSGGGDTDFGDDLEIVDLSARYTIEGVLGKGGMGEVQLATDNRLKRKVAIKRVLGDMAKNQTAVRRFMTEAQSIAALNHPNIVQVYDYGRDKNGPFLILEHVEGKSLLERCQQGAIPLEEAITLTCQVCDGLGKAHDAGIIHRDLKPANVLLTKDGVPKLTDFGLARVETSDTGHTMAGAVLGTLDFMPPEQRRDATQADARSDLWSLAATLYQMVTGKTPRIIRLSDVPPALQKVLGKALEDAKADRYQTAREFKEALRASLQDTGSLVTDLGEGRCVYCGTKNESHRKFCKECAVSLRVPCLQCNIQIPVWDKVCSECGTKQGDLLEERRKAMSAQQSQAESLLKNYDFDQAITIAVALRDEPDPRLHQLKDWSKQFLDEVESGRTQQLERIGTLLSEALQHEKAYDYPSGIHTLEQVPEILRVTSIPGQSLTPELLLRHLSEKQSEVHRLDELIRERVKSRQLNGLPEEVDRLLKLCPDRADLQKLKEQLASRDAKLMKTRDEAIAAAQQLLNSQDYPGAIEKLERIDPYVLRPEITTLREEAKVLQSRLQTLQKTIATAVEQKQLHGLLKTVEECLSLKAGDAELVKLRERLSQREGKNASQVINIVEKAEKLRSGCQFGSASRALQRIPEELQTQEVLDLRSDCDAMAAQRESALAALQSSIQSEDHELRLKITGAYCKAIHMAHLTDSEFETQYEAYQQALDAERKAAANAGRQRTLLIKLGMGAAVVVPLLVWGLLIRSSTRAAAEKPEADIAAAVEKTSSQTYDVDSSVAGETDIAAAADTTAADPSLLTAPFDQTTARKSQERWATYLGVPTELTNSIGMKLVLIPPGEFVMGSTKEQIKKMLSLPSMDKSYALREQPAHHVRLVWPYYLGAHEVTKGQFAKFVTATSYKTTAERAGSGEGLDSATGELVRDPRFNWQNLGIPQADNHPVTNVSSSDIAAFCEWLGRTDDRTYQLPKENVSSGGLSDLAYRRTKDRIYRLPKEAEWEYACRAGTMTLFYTGDDPEKAAAVSNMARRATTPVGSFPPNPFGLYDMLGNASELCQDAYAPDYTGHSSEGDPPASADPLSGVARGGSTASIRPAYSRSASRGGQQISLPWGENGFRVVREVPETREHVQLDIQTKSTTASASSGNGSTTTKPRPASPPIPTPTPKPTGDASAEPSSTRAAAEKREETLAIPPIRNSIGVMLKLIPAGKLTQPFYMGVYEVTQEQYERVMGSNPSRFKGEMQPVDNVRWNDAVAFCRKLSDLPAEKSAGRVYRLPTEAEWEYTCRAGTTTAYSFGDDAKDLGEYAWFVDNSGGTTHAVGEKLPNGWGLYDMHGNVFEWCLDGSDGDGSTRVSRGGGWRDAATYCRAASRLTYFPRDPGNRGFRLALSSPSVQ